MLDRGVRAAVELLNTIDGVTTRASCEGHSSAGGHTHSDLAYVAFAYPLPARLQSYLIAELDMVARVDDDAVYCRWPRQNREFLMRLGDAVRRDKRGEVRRRRQTAACLLSQLRARLAARAVSGQEATASLCLRCAALVVSPHRCAGTALPLLRWPPGLDGAWFDDFVKRPENSLDAGLRSALGTDELELRARRGDFGEQFRRRWLRYRRERAHLQMTEGLRAGIQQARKTGIDVDVIFDRRHARFSWSRAAGRASR
jgi:hypothetical protein